MKIGKLLGAAVRYAKANPETVLVVASALAPKLAAKVVPKIAQAVAASKIIRASER